MRYTVVAQENDEALAHVERVEGPSGIRWEVRLPDGSVVNSSGARKHGILSDTIAPEVFSFSSALGSYDFRVLRGAAGERPAGRSRDRLVLKASIPGKVIRIVCKPGDLIQSGQPLLVIEAMKMENEILAPQAGRVEELAVELGRSVRAGDLLVKLAAPIEGAGDA